MGERRWNMELGEEIGSPSMPEWQWRAFCDELIGTARRMAAIENGSVDPESLAVHDRIVAYQDAHGVDYTTAFGRVLEGF
jgi:hypothetical protein